MFGSSLSSVACLRAYVLFTLFCSLVVSNPYCVVFVVVLLQVSLECPSYGGFSVVHDNKQCHVFFALLLLSVVHDNKQCHVFFVLLLLSVVHDNKQWHVFF
jgi:hypothetical protein